MPPTLDIYREWLGIKESARPLNHYQILRLKQFEDDVAKIREHYRKMNAHVRKFAAGEFAKQSQDLLNELAKAMLCLTDTRRKREYDASLGRKDEGDGRAHTLEEILLLRKVIDEAQLEKARKFASSIGVELRDALVQQKMVRPDLVMPAYAESIGLPYLDVQDLPIDVRLPRMVPAVIARQHSCMPVLVDDKQLIMASPSPIDPVVEEQLRLRFGMPVRTVLCTAAGIHELIGKHYSREALEAAEAAGPMDMLPTPAAGKGGSAPAAGKDKAGKANLEPQTPEQRKQQIQMTIVAFNMASGFTAVVMSAVLNFGFMVTAAAAIPIGLIVAGIAWSVLGNRR
ncbi:MAG TPA: hypothetical protein VHY91_25645 [Pirellulales bacterium]|jgi:hypothetical protein|nr:hypothetical protein [Pirellulales bacterium]